MPDYYYEDVPYYPGYRILVDRDSALSGSCAFRDVNGRYWYREDPDNDEEYTRLAKRIADLHMAHWDDPNDILYVVNLPEVTIKPEDWQTELVNAFKGTNILSDIEDRVANPIYTRDYDLDQMISILKSDNNRLRRFYNMWTLAGKPHVRKASDLPDIFFKIGSLFGTDMGTKDKPRAHIIELHPSVMYITDWRDAISEISHPILNSFGKNNKFINWFDIFRYSDNDSNNGRYGNPKAMEYETHSVIEPQVSDYIFYNIIPDFLKNNK